MPGTMWVFAVHHYHGKETENPFMYTIPIFEMYSYILGFQEIFMYFEGPQVSRSLMWLWEIWDPTIQTNSLSSWWRHNSVHLYPPSPPSPTVRGESFYCCCSYYCCVTNQPNFTVLSTNHFIMLIDSVGQGFGQDTQRWLISCSLMSGAWAG